MSLENSKLKLVSLNENNPQVSKESKNQLILSNDRINSAVLEKLDAATLSQLGTILSSPGLIRIVGYFKDVRASTGQAVAAYTGIPESTVYRVLGRLVKLDFIAVVSVAKNKRKGGAIPKIYGVRGVRAEDISQAVLAHIRLTSPIYSAVQQVLPYLKTVNREVAYRDLIEISRPYAKGFKVNDVADIIAQDLRDRGVKVWR